MCPAVAPRIPLSARFFFSQTFLERAFVYPFPLFLGVCPQPPPPEGPPLSFLRQLAFFPMTIRWTPLMEDGLFFGFVLLPFSLV